MRNKAFTLMEMIMAAVLIALFAGLVSSTYLKRYHNAMLTDSIMQLKVMADYARSQAACSGQKYSLVFGADNKVMLASVSQQANDDQEQYEPVDNNYCKPITLADYIKIAQFEVDNDDDQKTASSQNQPESEKLERCINFYPQGGADNTVLSLSNGKKIVTMTISASTGKTKIYKGKITTPPAKRQDLDLGETSDM